MVDNRSASHQRRSAHSAGSGVRPEAQLRSQATASDEVLWGLFECCVFDIQRGRDATLQKELI